MAATGLRQRSRERRRSAIQESALRLFAAQGYDATTIADIAHDADVSPRTVSLYFPSKMDMATSYMDEAFSRLRDSLDSADFATAPALEVISAWLRAEMTEHTLLFGLQRDVGQANGQLRSLETPITAEATEKLMQRLVGDLGRDAPDSAVEIVGAAIGGVMTYLSQLDTDEPASDDAFDEAIKILRVLVDSCRR